MITRQLVAPDYDDRLVAKFDFEVPEDEAFVLQKVNEGFSRGALTRADWKRAMGYKVEPGDDVYILPYSMTVVPKGEAPAPKEEPAPEDVIDIIEPEKIAKGADMRQAHWKAADNRAREGEGMFRARTRAFADVQSARVRKELKSRAPDQYRAGLDEAGLVEGDVGVALEAAFGVPGGFAVADEADSGCHCCNAVKKP